MADPPPAPATATPAAAEAPRIFLVVVDETEEWRAALRYACRRAVHTEGRVALLRVVEPAEFQHWMAVEEVIREERRQEAEQQLQRVAKQVIEATGRMPALLIREGSKRDELMRLIDEDPTISVLVLGANPSSEGPGPLIQYLATKRFGRMPIPVTIVPGGLSEDRIDALT